MKEPRTMIPSKTVPLIMDEMEALDIDNLDDWKIAERKSDEREGMTE